MLEIKQFFWGFFFWLASRKQRSNFYSLKDPPLLLLRVTTPSAGWVLLNSQFDSHTHSLLLNCTLFLSFPSLLSLSLGFFHVRLSRICLCNLTFCYWSFYSLGLCPQMSLSVCVSSLFPLRIQSQCACAPDRLEQDETKIFKPALCLAWIRAYLKKTKLFLQNFPCRFIWQRTWLVLLLVNYPAAQTWTSSHSFVSISVEVIFYFLLTTKKVEKSQSETEAVPQQWKWHHHPQSHLCPQMAIYGSIHPWKHHHSPKYVPCGINCSLFEVFSLSLVFCVTLGFMNLWACGALRPSCGSEGWSSKPLTKLCPQHQKVAIRFLVRLLSFVLLFFLIRYFLI